jgi:two-component system nitrogen regulation response regulator NtrX
MHGSHTDYLIKPTDLPPEILGHDPMVNNKNNFADLELSLKDARKVFEENYLKQQLVRLKGNIARTSNFIGMDRSALHRKIKELDINIDKFN